MRKNRFLDVIPDSQSASAGELQQVDRTVTGTVSEILGDGVVAVSIDGSTEPDVVVPSASGITAVGASVRVSRDSSGRAVEASIPDRIPYGAPVMAVGVTGEWLAQLDATTSSTQAQLEDTRAALDESQAYIEGTVVPGLADAQQAAEDAATAAATAIATGVVSVITQWAVGSSETVAPSSGWSTSTPTRTPGTFIWSRTVTTKGDGTQATSSAVLITGNAGAPGADGAGIEIAGSVPTYAALPSGLGSGDAGKAYLVQADGRLYIWDGSSWPADGAGVEFRGPKGDAGTDGSDGSDGVSVAAVTPYYALVGTGVVPAKPATNPPTAPWSLTEPAHTSGTELYRVDLTVMSGGAWSYGAVSKVSAYTAAAGAVSVANLARESAEGLVKVSRTDPGHAPGRVWEVLNADDRVIGMKISDGSAWSSYGYMVEDLMVVGEDGTIRLRDGVVSAPTIQATTELWAKILAVAGDASIGGNLLVNGSIGTSKLSVTESLWTALLNVAGDATIGGTLLTQTLVGKILQGGLLLAGGGDLPQVLVGPLSGQVGTGDQYGISITTPNNNANGAAVIAVAPTGPFLEFYDGTGALVLAADKTGVRVINRADGGMVDLSKLTTQRWTWTRTGTRTVAFNNTNGTNSGTWAFFTDANNTNAIGTILKVSSPTGRLRVDGGVRIAQSSGTYGNESLAVQWGVYSSNPANNDRTDVTNGLVKGAAECYYQNTATPFFGIGTSIVDVTPNVDYYIRPFYRQGVMGATVTRNVGDMWVSVTPA